MNSNLAGIITFEDASIFPARKSRLSPRHCSLASSNHARNACEHFSSNNSSLESN